MLHYILQAIIFQLLFLMVYDVFLKKETFFNWNRAYLLVSAFLAVVLPFVKIDSFKQIIPQEYIFRLPEVFIGTPQNEAVTKNLIVNNEAASQFVFNWHYIIYLGCVIALVLFAMKLINILVLAYKNPKTKFKNVLLIELVNSTVAFSFFNYVFLGSNIKPEEKEAILAHELEHVKQNHSVDLLFFEILRIVFWFNPLVYIYQRKMADLHEFIADSKAIKTSNKKSYYQNLLAQVFDTKTVSFINPFFKQSLIKKRIIMLSKTKSKQINLVKYLLLIPMVFTMLFYTSCEDVDSENQLSKKELEKYSYSMNLNSENSEETIAQVKETGDFLYNNQDYVSWIIVDYTKGISSISIHPKSEVPPSGYENLTTDLKNGKVHQAYRKFIGKETLSQSSNNEDITFALLDEAPVFPGCEKEATDSEIKNCFTSSISKFVAQNFELSTLDDLGLVGKIKITAKFVIDKEGNVKDIVARTPHLKIQNEILRVIKLLPSFKPGKQDGKPVNVKFVLPVSLNIKE